MIRRILALEDLTRFVAVSDPRISPDGAQIAYVLESLDLDENETRSAIWVVPYAGGEPRQLTAGRRHDSAPRWSPDGQMLAFVSDREGTRQIYLLPLGGGEPRRLTDHPVGAHDPEWSPDGRRLAFLADGADRRSEPVPVFEKDGRRRVVRVSEHRHKLDGRGFRGPAARHVWQVDVATGEMAQLTDGPHDDWSLAWSPNGGAIAFISDRAGGRDLHYEGGQLHVLDVATGVLRRLTSDESRAANPAWAPDGRRIAYVAAIGPHDASPSDNQLWLADAAGGEPACLSAALGRAVGVRPAGYLTPSRPTWHEGALYYLAGTGGATHLWRFDGAEPTRVTEGGHAALELTAAGGRFAMTVATSTSPAELHVWDPAGGARSLTSHNARLLGELDLPAPERLDFARDDAAYEGWLIRPPAAARAAGPVPLVLSVHGGPHNYFGETWNLDHQLFAARGYAVLYVNPRGSGGYGEGFAGLVVGDWGGEDFADQLAAIDRVLERADPPVDARRLAIFGSSYGGFMTCWALTQTDRFAVGVAGACISNLVSFYGTSDLGASWGAMEFGGTPDERLDWYLGRSPLTHARRVTAPLLLYHGEDDLRCPIEQSEQMFTALRRLGRTVEMVRLPGENHGALAGTPVHRVEARRCILDWLSSHLRQ